MAKHERADIDPSAVTSTELREAIGVAGPLLRGDLLSAYGELLETDPVEARSWLLQLDGMDIELAEILRAGSGDPATDRTAHAAQFFATGLELAKQDGSDLAADDILRRMGSAEGSDVDLSGLREQLAARTHTHSFGESVVANIRLSYADDHLRNGTRLGWAVDTDNARAVVEFANAHRQAEQLATDVDVNAGIRWMLAAGMVAGGLRSLADGISLTLSTIVIGLGASLAVGGAIHGQLGGRRAARGKEESARTTRTRALNALHAPIAVGSDGAPAARDRLGTAVVPHQTVARRHR